MPQPEKLSLSVVVPVYNERDNLSPLTAQILKALTGQVSSFEIIYVDDGSTDGSGPLLDELARDRKSTRLNSSHSQISYAVFCLKKKKRLTYTHNTRQH